MPRIDDYDILTNVMGLKHFRDAADENDDRSPEKREEDNENMFNLLREFFNALYNGQIAYANHIAKMNNWPREDVDSYVLFWFRNGG